MLLIEKDFLDFVFVCVNCDDYIELVQQWNIFGILSFVVVENGQELGCLVNKNCKIKVEIIKFFVEINYK